MSAPRYGRYLAVAEGDHRRALDLYLWNARAAAAVLVDVGHVEVALRNSYDRELSRVFPNWATDHHSPAFQRTQGVERARHAQRQSNERNLAQLRRVWPGTSGRLNHHR
ncbi:MAG TPA: hypothetical protein PKE32_05460, partial [Miltoncostaeaceae bacterium]|nr:hypothetical protein [Miltoncostaeaceae bacterium]